MILLSLAIHFGFQDKIKHLQKGSWNFPISCFCPFLSLLCVENKHVYAHESSKLDTWGAWGPGNSWSLVLKHSRIYISQSLYKLGHEISRILSPRSVLVMGSLFFI